MRRTPATVALRGLTLLLALLLLASATVRPHGTALAACSGEACSLEGRMEVLEDAVGTLGLGDLLRSERFDALPGLLNKGYSDSAWWVRIRLERPEWAGESCWLRFEAPAADRLEAWVLLPGKDAGHEGSYRSYRLGLAAPIGERALKVAQQAVPVRFDGEGRTVAYLRIASSSPVQLGGEVLDNVALATLSRNALLLQSIYLAAVAIAATMSLLVFLSVRDRAFLFFALYAADILLAYLVLRGVHIFLFPSSGPLLAPLLSATTFGAGAAFFALFAHAVFNQTGSEWELLYLRAMAVVGGADAVAALLGWADAVKPLTIAAALGFLWVLMRLALRRWQSLSPGMRLLAATLVINLLLYALFFLQSIGLLAWNPQLLDALQLLSLAHIGVLFILLIQRTLHAERRLKEDILYAEKWAMATAENKTRDIRRYRDDLKLSLLAEQRSAERAGRFFAMISHEYRTPLAIIQGNLDIMQRHWQENGGNIGQMLTSMRRAVGRLLTVLEEAVDRSRLLESAERGKGKRIGVCTYLEQQIESAAILWPMRRIETKCDAAGEEVEGDPLLLDMALFNILDNAVKYSPPGSTVTVCCHVEKGAAMINVENATLMPPEEDGDCLFGKFSRGSNSAGAKGEGIGLWMVQEIMLQHGGSATFECSGGERVRVSLRLPIAGEAL